MSRNYVFIKFSDNITSEWDTLVKQSPDGWVWGLSNWINAVSDVEAWRVKDFSFAISDGQSIVGVMPLQFDPVSKWLVPTKMGFGGPILKKDLPHSVRRNVKNAIFEHCEIIAYFNNARGIKVGIQPVSETGMTVKNGINPYSYAKGYSNSVGVARIVDLRLDFEHLWHDLSETAKQTIKKAKKLGYTTEEISWPESVDTYYKIHVETYTRTGVPPHPKQYFYNIANKIANEGLSKLFCCRDEKGQIVAFHNAMLFNDRGLYHTGCSLNHAIKNGVNYLLLYESMLNLKKIGINYYEIGEIFPNISKKCKLSGLSAFKTKFGGEDYCKFSAEKSFHIDRLEPLRRIKQSIHNIITSAKEISETRKNLPYDKINKYIFEHSSYWSEETVSVSVKKINEETYSNLLLKEKISLVKRYLKKTDVLCDLCCGNGAILQFFIDSCHSMIGIDTSQRYLSVAEKTFSSQKIKPLFLKKDITKHFILKKKFDICYCFSSLYVIHDLNDFIKNIYNNLSENGIAILDFGNSRSLNAFCCKFYKPSEGYSYLSKKTIDQQLKLVKEANFKILEHKSFQILPLWATRPLFLYPLLLPVWKKIMSKKINGIMLDEYLSSLPLIRKFAFRHIVVIQKI